MDPARELATYADLLALPEGERAEIVAGEIVVQPSPLPRHNWTVRTLWLRRGGWTRGDKVRVRPFETIEIEIERFIPSEG